MNEVKTEGTIQKLSTDNSEQTILAVNNDVENNTISKEDKISYEEFKTIYKDKIDATCKEAFGSCEDKDLWEDAAKELFLQSKNYIMTGDEYKAKETLENNKEKITESNVLEFVELCDNLKGLGLWDGKDETFKDAVDKYYKIKETDKMLHEDKDEEHWQGKVISEEGACRLIKLNTPDSAGFNYVVVLSGVEQKRIKAGSDDKAKKSFSRYVNVPSTKADLKESKLEEGFFNLYNSFDNLYRISKYNPTELKEFLDDLKKLNRISDSNFDILMSYANDWQDLINKTGYESHLEESKLQEDQYENERRRGVPAVKRIAEQEYQDNIEWYKAHSEDYTDMNDFVQRECAEIASEYNLSEDKAKEACKELYKLMKTVNGLDRIFNKKEEDVEYDKCDICKSNFKGGYSLSIDSSTYSVCDECGQKYSLPDIKSKLATKSDREMRAKNIQAGDKYINENGVTVTIINADDLNQVTYQFDDGKSFCTAAENVIGMLDHNRYKKVNETKITESRDRVAETLSKFIYDLTNHKDFEKYGYTAWSGNAPTTMNDTKVYEVYRNGKSNFTLDDIKEAVLKEYPELKIYGSKSNALYFCKR